MCIQKFLLITDKQSRAHFPTNIISSFIRWTNHLNNPTNCFNQMQITSPNATSRIAVSFPIAFLSCLSWQAVPFSSSSIALWNCVSSFPYISSELPLVRLLFEQLLLSSSPSRPLCACTPVWLCEKHSLSFWSCWE